MHDAVPGQTPLDDISGLKDRGIRTLADLNAAEAMNIRKAMVKYLLGPAPRRTAPFDVRWAKRLHAEMFGDVWSWAGMLRRRDTNLGVPPPQIAQALSQLLDDLHSWMALGMPLDEQAARLHYRAVSIHPFHNGNGRWARTLANIWLRRNQRPLVEWPLEMVGAASIVRDEYLAAVRQGDLGDITPLLALHRRFTPG